jgi:GrpB-like predicted nucleotidyltransferase (UPF0157 family)
LNTQTTQSSADVGRRGPQARWSHSIDKSTAAPAQEICAEFEDYLDRVLIGRRDEMPIVLDDYDESWPNLFDRHRARIACAVGHAARRIEHVGSTSVPGLAAKPIIDILVAVDDVEDEPAYVPALESCGYLLRIREPGHRMLRTPEISVHVHVWTIDCDEQRRVLLFRDWLRRSRADRSAYEALKRRLARRNWTNRSYYARAKGPLIAELVGRAERWAARTGWSA